MKLNRESSHELVKELILVLGEKRAHAMWDKILGPEKKAPTRSTRRTISGSLLKAV